MVDLIKHSFSCIRVQNQKIILKTWTLSLLGKVATQTKTSTWPLGVKFKHITYMHARQIIT
jgi:hypothetical protein